MLLSLHKILFRIWWSDKQGLDFVEIFSFGLWNVEEDPPHATTGDQKDGEEGSIGSKDDHRCQEYLADDKVGHPIEKARNAHAESPHILPENLRADDPWDRT